MGINEELAAIEQRVKELAVEIGRGAATVDDEIRWIRAADVIDLFRNKVSGYYGFENEKIIPVQIDKKDDPLYHSVFHVKGIVYEVSNAELTCLGEL